MSDPLFPGGRLVVEWAIATIDTALAYALNPSGEPLNDDLTGPLERWAFEPDRLVARLVELEDDRRVLQVRVELGMLQMELTGRPDGGADRLAQVEEAVRRDPELKLDSALAAELRSEAVQVHQRYVALLALEIFDLVVDDTSRNLRVFDLCRDRASEADDRTILEQFRPQVLATRARAAALIAVRERQTGVARNIIDAAVNDIRAALSEGAPEPPEIPMLEGMRDVLQPQLPISQRHDLEQRLLGALASENYELAAILRDELRRL
ncbi:MAG: hypothetical protein P8J59_11730 [Phycisphaerales bacterium]|nr:hypothetical protein [Phycisphaerales bacterium]